MSLFEKKTFLSNKLAKLYAENQTLARENENIQKENQNLSTNIREMNPGFTSNTSKSFPMITEIQIKINDYIKESITSYLVKLSKCELSNKEKGIVASTFHVIIDIERIGDHAENIVELATEKINKNLQYVLFHLLYNILH